jgi:hypothetical protein
VAISTFGVATSRPLFGPVWNTFLTGTYAPDPTSPPIYPTQVAGHPGAGYHYWRANVQVNWITAQGGNYAVDIWGTTTSDYVDYYGQQYVGVYYGYSFCYA